MTVLSFNKIPTLEPFRSSITAPSDPNNPTTSFQSTFALVGWENKRRRVFWCFPFMLEWYLIMVLFLKIRKPLPTAILSLNLIFEGGDENG